MDVSKITERLWCGAQINDAADVAHLKSMKITHIIDAQIERDDAPLLGPDFSYLYDPIADDGQHPKPVEWFERAIMFALDAFTHHGAVVMTHCAAGINRGPSLAYAILRAQGLHRETAELLLRSGRPQVGIAYRDDADLALIQLGWYR